jgi:hypothetical protein
MSCPSHPALFDHSEMYYIYYIIYYIMKLLITKFFLVPCYFIPLRQNNFLSTGSQKLSINILPLI